MESSEAPRELPRAWPVAGRRDLRRFIRLPWALYRGAPRWVPPLLRDERRLFAGRDAFFAEAAVQLFLAGRGAVPAGRVAAIEDRRFNEFHGERRLGFGFFECPDDQLLADCLLEAVRAWGRARGLELLWGPVNFSTNRTCGTLVEGFDRPPRIMMPYNPPWHDRLLRGAGLAPARDLLAWRRGPQPLPERFAAVQARLRARRRITVRPLRLKRYAEELALVARLYNGAWERNWGFVPMSAAEFAQMGQELRPLVDPELVLFAAIDGREVGFSLAVPDVNEILIKLGGRLLPWGIFRLLWGLPRVRAARLLALGVLREHRASGVDAVLYAESISRGLARGYREAELGWVLENNDLMNNAIRNLGAVIDKRYRLYEQILNPAQGSPGE